MKTMDLTKGHVFNVLLTMALPIIGSSVLQYTFSLVDMLLVGQLGYDAVASIGSASFLINVGYAINACVVVGTGIKVAHAIGANQDELKSRYVNAGFFLNGIVALLFAIIMLCMGQPFLHFLELEGAIFDMSYAYLLVSIPTLAIAFFNLWYTRLYNSFGSNQSALKISVIGVVLNIVLDLVFIYGLNLHVIGAGLATLTANLVMFSLFFIQSRNIFQLRLSVKHQWTDIKAILTLGIPSAIQRVLFTLINIMMARFIARYGAEAIAAQKIALQIESVTFMVVGGLNGAIAAFIGQNFGAKQVRRITAGVRASLTMGTCYALVTTAILYTFGHVIASLFVQDEQTIHIATNYLKIVGLSQLFMAIEQILNGIFTGLGLPKIPATISILFTLGRIPLALAFMPLFGIDGIWLSIAISSVMKGIAALIMYVVQIKRGGLNVTTA